VLADGWQIIPDRIVRSREPFKLWRATTISPEQMKLVWLHFACSESRDLFKFWEISDNLGNGAGQRHSCIGTMKRSLLEIFLTPIPGETPIYLNSALHGPSAVDELLLKNIYHLLNKTLTDYIFNDVLSVAESLGWGRLKMHDLKMTDWKMTDKEADFTCCRPRQGGINCCCGSRSWTAVLLLLMFVDVDAVVVVADLLSEKPGNVYPKAVVYGTQKLKFRLVCSSIIVHGALM